MVSSHREENIDVPSYFASLIALLNGLAERFQLPIIFSAHPRTRKRFDTEGVALRPEIRILTPLGLCDYVHLEIDAKATLSDSGTITEESSILNFRALNIRDAHERPEGMEEAAVMLTGLNLNRVCEGLRILGSQPRGGDRMLRPVADYTVPNVAEKVVRIIISYTDYVNRVVWQKSTVRTQHSHLCKDDYLKTHNT